MRQVAFAVSPVAAVAPVAALLVIWMVPPASNWFHAFVKLEPMRVPYTATFFGLLWLSSALLSAWLKHRSVVTAVSAGAATGYLIAVVSLLVANLFIPDGPARTVRTVEQLGLLRVLMTDAIVAFVLGGWILGAVAFAMLRILLRRNRDPGGPVA